MPEDPNNPEVTKMTQYRLSELETWKREIQQELRALRSVLSEMRIILARAEGNPAETCPAPGKCLALEQRLEKTQEQWQARMRAVEVKLGLFTGGLAVVAFVSPLVWQILLRP